MESILCYIPNVKANIILGLAVQSFLEQTKTNRKMSTYFSEMHFCYFLRDLDCINDVIVTVKYYYGRNTELLNSVNAQVIDPTLLKIAQPGSRANVMFAG